MLRKIFTLHNVNGVGQIKAVGDGKVTAVFSTLNVMDKDEDVTLPGAFGAQKAKISPAHDWGEPGMGVADIREEGNEAIAEMKFYLDMASASEWYKSIKNNFDNGVPQEYSYGYDVLDSGAGMFGDKQVRLLKSLKVHEVSPVMIGAGVNTRTVNAKRRKESVDGIQTTKSVEGSWEDLQEEILDAANDLLVPPPINGQPQGWCCLAATNDTTCVVAFYPVGVYEANYYQFDWTLNDDDTVTLSNRRDVELSTVVQPKSFDRRLDAVRDHLAAIGVQSKLKEGRVLSSANVDKLSRLMNQLSTVNSELQALLQQAQKPTDEGKAQQAEIFKLLAQSQRTLARVNGHIR